MPCSSPKREKLLDAARLLIHQQGYRTTTLADIAEQSGVPLGNVYYYFKTKDDLARAVIHEHQAGFQALFEDWERTFAEPRARLAALLDHVLEWREILADSGCPIGSLCQELGKQDGALAAEARTILEYQLEWVQRQFRAMGRDDAEELALQFITHLQGISLMAHALGDPEIVDRQIAELHRRLDDVQSGRRSHLA